MTGVKDAKHAKKLKADQEAAEEAYKQKKLEEVDKREEAQAKLADGNSSI